MVLTIGFPGYRTTRAEQYGSAHAAKLEEGKENSRTDSVPDLGPPTGVTIGGETMVILFGWRDRVLVIFSIRAEWKGHVHVQRDCYLGQKCKPIVDS